MTRTTRFDYLKVIYRQDAEMAQDEFFPWVKRFVSAISGFHKSDREQYKVSVVGNKLDKRLYVAEFWGELADAAVAALPKEMWARVYRLDHRVEDDEITESVVNNLQFLVNSFPPSTIGYNTFTTPGATKNDRRDVGGKGIRIGSRKSDHHFVIYKRRGGPGAAEYRISGRQCNDYCKGLAQDQPADNPYDLYDRAHEFMQGRLDRMIKTGFRVDNLEALKGLARATQPALDGAKILADYQEQAEADAWLEGLPEQQQIELQEATWAPTPKGLHEPGS